MSRLSLVASRIRSPNLDHISIAAYVFAIWGALGLHIREPFDEFPVESGLTWMASVFLLIGGAAAILARKFDKNWLELIGVNFALGGSCVGFLVVVLLDIVPTWPPLARPVWTILGLAFMVIFFLARSTDLNGRRFKDGTGPRLPTEEAIEKADEIRENLPPSP